MSFRSKLATSLRIIRLDGRGVAASIKSGPASNGLGQAVISLFSDQVTDTQPAEMSIISDGPNLSDNVSLYIIGPQRAANAARAFVQLFSQLPGISASTAYVVAQYIYIRSGRGEIGSKANPLVVWSTADAFAGAVNKVTCDVLAGHWCSVAQNNPQPAAYGVPTVVTFDTLVEQTETTMWTAAAPTRVVAPVAGLYLVTVTMTYAAATGAIRLIQMWRNGSQINPDSRTPPAQGGWETSPSYTRLVRLAAGDYIEVSGYQAAVNPLNINRTALDVVRFGP